MTSGEQTAERSLVDEAVDAMPDDMRDVWIACELRGEDIGVVAEQHDITPREVVALYADALIRVHAIRPAAG